MKQAGFNIHAKESLDDRKYRHEIMAAEVNRENLVFKINPGKIDLFDAASDGRGNISDSINNENIVREFVTKIDLRVKESLLNRAHMKLIPIEIPLDFNHRNSIILRKGTIRKPELARKSIFIKEAVMEEDESMESSFVTEGSSQFTSEDEDELDDDGEE